MTHHHHRSDQSAATDAFFKFILFAFLGIIGYFLFVEHRAHLMGFLPWLFLLICPLMHLFMHGGHGDHGGNDPSGGGHSGHGSGRSNTLR
jgi:hypothetical protein